MEHIMTGTHSKEFWMKQIEIAGIDNVSYSLEIAEFNEEYEQASLIRDAMQEFTNKFK